MSQNQSKTVSEPTLRRLPLYHRFLQELQQSGREHVSCTDISLNLKLDAAQVRKDLEAAGIVGRPRVGYVLNDLVDQIESFLGWKNVNEAFLVGAGSLGAALLGYKKFEQCGLKIVAAFDTDDAKEGTRIHDKLVLPLAKLVDLTQRMHILIGIVTVPAAQAQEVADLMVSGGMRAIWNFAPVRLRVPGHVIVHNEDLYCSLASLSQKLSKALLAAPTAEPSLAPRKPALALN
jgi:redox-sensing transcriptional repressor